MDARQIIESWKQRLLAMARNPDYVFRDTPRVLIDAYVARMTTFSGYTELEITEAERQQQVGFPSVFRTFLLEMGRSTGGLFKGSDLARLSELDAFRVDALELLAEHEASGTLPPRAIVFLSHQGYQFMFLQQDGGFDAPVMFWSEGDAEPQVLSPSFADLVQDQLALMEANHRSSHESGGYYLTLLPGGGGQQSYPARASGIRPLDETRKPWGTLLRRLFTGASGAWKRT